MFVYNRLIRTYVPFISKRHFISALYITGDKASTNFAVLTPYLDFEERMKDKPGLLQNIKLRKRDIDLEKIEKHWNFFKSLDDQRIILETTKNAMVNEITRLMKDPERNRTDVEKLKLYLKQTKNDHKSLRDYLYGIEESAALNALSLPNILDTRTPCENEVDVYTFLDKPSEQSKFHLDIATSTNLIECTNPINVYLKNDAALLEFFTISFLHDILQNHSFTPFVNTSFGRSIIAEGCCTDYFNKSAIFTIKEDTHSISRLHFFGGATLHSFMAYFARFSIQSGYFPLKLYTCGRQYNPIKSDHNSLFNLEQYTAAEIFIITKDDEIEYNKEFDAIANIAKEIYESLGYHFKFVYSPAHELKNFESLRLSIQMYSCHAQKYIEIGHISLCDSYLSKRLLVTYTENKERKYSRIISGTLLNVQKLLGCILEYNNITDNRGLLSDTLKRYAPVI